MKNGYYRFTSERARSKSIAQFLHGEWYCLNEVGPVTMEELNRRGWTLDSRVKGMKI